MAEGDDMNAGSKVIVIREFWARVISGILVAAILSGIGYAWTANAANAVLSEDVKTIKAARLDQRLTRIEAQLEFLVSRERRANNR